MSQTTPAVEITPAQLQQFHDEGYFILERVLTDAQLASLRSECQRFIAAIDEDMDRQGVEVQGINHKGKRYFVGG